MDKLDAAMQQRVWQRVRSGGQPPAFQPLAAAEQNMAATYRMLSSMLQGSERVLLRRLFESERHHARLLAGLYLLQEEKPLTIRGVPLTADRPETAVRKCYAQTLRAIRNYRECSDDPEQGHIFRELARQEEEHARLLLEILGSIAR